MRDRRQYALDTETPLGKLGCIATNEEVIEASSFEEVMDFLGKHRYHGVIFWTFNLQFDIEHILKSTNDKGLLQEIYDYGVKRPGIDYCGYKIQYIPRKLFKVCKNKHCFTVYDIAQFYNGASLEKAAQQYLGEGKDPMDAKAIGEKPGYFEEHLEDILKYCQRDADLTLKLARIIENTFTSQGISFRNPISQAKIAEIYVTDNFKYPKVPKGLEDAHEWAHRSYHGGLFWTLQRGYFRQPVYAFDINSAYPSVMASLPHWGNGEFKWVDSPSEDPTVYGWYSCEFDCPWIPMFEDAIVKYDVTYPGKDLCKKAKLSYTVQVNTKRKIYPTGRRWHWYELTDKATGEVISKEKRWGQVITKVEYEWMRAHNFPCKFITGLEWHKTQDKYESPFTWIPKLFKKRQEIKATDTTGMLQYALKIVLNGIYGKTAQSKKGMGKLTNFFYASYITAVTRLAVAEVALKNLSAVVEIATDSVTLTKDISAEIPISKELGEWGLDSYQEGIFIGSGMRQEWRSLGGESVTYARGLTDKRDFDLKAFLVKNREEHEAWFTRKRPIHLGEMLLHHKALSFEDLGVFTDVSKRLNVNTDKKQVWDRDFVNFGDLLDSKPMGGTFLTC
jgi:hypothetical protein